METSKYYSQKVFLVDDDPWIVGLYEKVMNNLGYTDVKIFLSGESCIGAMNEAPDIIFLDQNMGQMSGLETLRKIKSCNEDNYVVFISSLDNIETALTSIKLGAYDYVVKGDGDKERIEQIVTKIQEAIDQK